MILVLKESQVNEVMERRDIKHMEVLNFNGKLFLPRTLPFDEELVNKKFVVISIDGNSYLYEKKIGNSYVLANANPREVPVYRGQTIISTHKVRLFFAREVEK